jgi:hypothetical protein
MELRDGGTYRFDGDHYLLTIEDSELSGETVASLQRLPVNQIDDEPSLFVQADGAVVDTDGHEVGRQSDLIDSAE